MVDVKTADQALQTYIRPQSFPVAVRMLRPGEPIPERAKRPARDFGKLSMNCQVIDMARRYGWMIALTREDHICSLGITALGFDRPTHLYTSGTLCEGMYTPRASTRASWCARSIARRSSPTSSWSTRTRRR